MRTLARASATREVSAVIHRLPHCSATNAVVPDPHVGSRTRSPGSVAKSTQRATTLVFVSTTYLLSCASNPHRVSSHRLFTGITGKSRNRLKYEIDALRGMSRFDIPSLFNPTMLVFQYCA